MFCSNCGNQIEDGYNVCPNCGVNLSGNPLPTDSTSQFNNAAPVDNAAFDNSSQVNNVPPVYNAPPVDNYSQINNAPPMYNAPPVYNTGSYQAPNGNNNNALIATICGALSIAIGVLGSFMFGIFAAAISVILGIVAIVLGISAKKETNNAKGNAGFVCGIVGLVVGVVFAVGCGICGATESAVNGRGYSCYGCVGGNCLMRNDYNSSYRDLFDALDYWY